MKKIITLAVFGPCRLKFAFVSSREVPRGRFSYTSAPLVHYDRLRNPVVYAAPVGLEEVLEKAESRFQR